MRPLSSSLLAATAVVLYGQPTLAESDKEYVVTLTKDNFSDFISKGRKIVEFYAPWCGHCKQLAPEYEAAAKQLSEKKRKTKLGKMDATVEGGIASEYGVQGYPTMFYFVDGVKAEYNGPRQEQGIVDWVEARERDPVELCTEEELKEKVSSKVTPYLIRAEVPKKSGKLAALKKAMSGMITNSYTQVTACLIPITKEDEKAGKSTVKLYRTDAHLKADEEVNWPTGRVFNAGKVASWLHEGMFSGVGNYTVKKYEYLPTAMSSIRYVVSVAAAGKDEQLVDSAKWAEALAKASKDKAINKEAVFAIWEGSGDTRRDMAGMRGETSESLLVALENGGTKKYALRNPTPDGIIAWTKKLLKGDLKPDYKTQVEPENPYDDDVRVLVGSNFESVALNPEIDAFVEFYAPWCGHCKKLAPEWSKLAKNIKAMGLDKKVVIAKFDATENESVMTVDGFPKLVLFPAMRNADKKFKEYKGNERDANAFMDFLSEAAVNMEGQDLPGEKIDKSSFSMVDRERKKKAKKAKAEL